ncbi:uncharacterized protein LOC128118005 [Peromyscus californicus insignis]|uniref:uncharacterized protein LOC128118005 n=1 Tax=Peromyscus californicus insignis TaxID=564181 RepID=UPI0022A66EC4|nr:uncharacterized protein LOC128118005 [Peromyscus californicus insignis]
MDIGQATVPRFLSPFLYKVSPSTNGPSLKSRAFALPHPEAGSQDPLLEPATQNLFLLAEEPACLTQAPREVSEGINGEEDFKGIPTERKATLHGRCCLNSGSCEPLSTSPTSVPLCRQGKDTKDEKPTHLIRSSTIRVQRCHLTAFKCWSRQPFFFQFLRYNIWMKKSIDALPASQDVVTIKSDNLLKRTLKTVNYYAKSSYSCATPVSVCRSTVSLGK